MPTAPLRRQVMPLAVGLLALPLLLSACSSSSTASDETTTTASTTGATSTACALISPSEIRSTMGTSVGAPTSTVRGSVTTCTYKAANLSRSVLIQYNTTATKASFTQDKATISSGNIKVTPIQGLGNEAYSFSKAAHPYTTNTVVTIQNSLQTIVTGTSSPDQVKTMAEEILYKIDQHDAAASSTTLTTSP